MAKAKTNNNKKFNGQQFVNAAVRLKPISCGACYTGRKRINGGAASLRK